MTESQMKRMFQTIVAEAVQKAKKDFDALPSEMDATEALQTVLSDNFFGQLDERIFRTAKSFAIPDIGTEGIRAYVKAVSMPANKTKHLAVGLEIENTLDNRMAIAKLDGAAVNLYCAQLDIESYANREDAEEQLDIEVDELAESIANEMMGEDEE